MAFGPIVEERESDAARAYKNPKKAVIDLLRGMARGAITTPGDLSDFARMGMGLPAGDLGERTRAALRDTPLRETGAAGESIGELLGPPGKTLAKIGTGIGTAMMVPARRAADAGMLDPQAIIDALKMKKAGVKPEKIWQDTMVEITKPGALPGAKSHAMTAIETPGYKQGGAPGGIGMSAATLGERLKSGDVAGLENLLKLYPELAQTMVKKTAHGDPGKMGSFWPAKNEISLNYNSGAPEKEFSGVLAHELYHGGPENIDKLPPGASPESAGQRQGVGGMILQRGERDHEAAFLARSLAENRGLLDRGYGNAMDPAELMRLYANDKSSKGAPPLTKRALIAALKHDSTELMDRLGTITDLRGKVAPSPMHSYLTTWGERNARVSEKQAGQPPEWLRANPPSTLERIPEKSLWDMREFTPQVWRDLGLL